MNECDFDKISELKARITELIKKSPAHELPKTLTFNEGMGMPIYKITIEADDADSFIDDMGRKWIRKK